MSTWILAAGTAAVLYGLLLIYLLATKHAVFHATAEKNAGCVDHREDVKYRVPGGTGTFSLGLVPLLLYLFVFPNWTWLVFLAQVQFIMSIPDVLMFWGQLLKDPDRGEFILLRSHGLRHPGCGRTSAWDPIGGTLYLIQIITGWKGLGVIRGIVQLPYDVVGMGPAFVLNLPFVLLKGKFVFPWPF